MLCQLMSQPHQLVLHLRHFLTHIQYYLNAFQVNAQFAVKPHGPFAFVKVFVNYARSVFNVYYLYKSEIGKLPNKGCGNLMEIGELG
jgi:hypothetical protein